MRVVKVFTLNDMTFLEYNDAPFIQIWNVRVLREIKTEASDLQTTLKIPTIKYKYTFCFKYLNNDDVLRSKLRNICVRL